jgi:hypothetical protein
VDHRCGLIRFAPKLFLTAAGEQPAVLYLGYLIHPVASADASSSWPLRRASAAMAA